MDNSPGPEQTVRLFRAFDSELHVLVGLPVHSSLLQTLRKVDVRSLRGYSWKRVDPAHLSPRPGRVPCLLFKLPPRARIRVFAVINQPGWKFQLPALYWVAVVPDEDQAVMVQHWDYDGKVVKGQPKVAGPESRLLDDAVLVKLHFAERHELPRAKSLPGLWGFAERRGSRPGRGRFQLEEMVRRIK